MTQFATLPLAHIAPSLTNPRKTFNAAKLQELADSIKASGVHQAVLVRPISSARLMDTEREVQYELVAGERRYRASQLAGVDTIPAMIRVLTDDQVLEIQLVENLQRDDLSELEEAEGYQALMEHSSLTADAVGTKIGKSRAYVYARLKLLDLSQEVKQAMRDGALDFSRALLIARIPDSALQAKALAEATCTDYRGDVPSVRALQAWLQQNVMLRLDKAVFKITDTRLVQAAGSCTACPKRTGANPDLFADASSADLCIDPACYHGKEDAHRAALVAIAAKKGMQFIEGKEAKELIPQQWTDHIRGYLPLSQKREDCIKDGQTGLTLRELLGDDAPAPVLIENPYTKALIEAVPEDETEGVLTAKGLRRVDADDDGEGDKAKARGLQSWDSKALQKRLETIKDRIDANTERSTHSETLKAARKSIRGTDEGMAKLLIGPSLLRNFLTTAIDGYTAEFMAEALGYTFAQGEDKEDGLAMHIRATDHANLSRAAAIIMMECESDWTYNESTSPVRDFVCESLQVNTKTIAKTAAKEAQAQYADELREIEALIEAKNKPKKDDPPQSPLAQPKHAAGVAVDGAKPKLKPAAAARKSKLSAQDAQSGIAAAMQEQERAGTTPPEAQQGEMQSGLAVGFVTGQRVRITTNPDRLSTTARKWSGREGTVAKTNADHDPDLYDVTFKGRNGGIAMFRTDQLEAVEVATV